MSTTEEERHIQAIVDDKLKRRLTEPDISRPKFTSVASDTARRRASKKGATTDIAKAFARVNYEKAAVLYAKSH